MPTGAQLGKVCNGHKPWHGLRIGRADGWYAIFHREAIGARIGAEVAVERAILLHDDHDMLDLVNARIWTCLGLVGCLHVVHHHTATG
jgi:hypothetical protein